MVDKNAAISARIVPWDGAIGVGYILVPAQNSESRRKPRDFCVAALPSLA